MSKPTIEEMKKWLCDFDYRYYSIGVHHPYLIVPVTERDQEIFKAIMDAIENMDKKVSREFVEKWAKEFSGFIEGYDTKILLETMFAELGHEVEKQGGRR